MTDQVCDSCRAVAAELALGIAVGDERAAALEHLSDCASCRRELDGLTATLDALVTAAPSVDPPPGFADRAMHSFRNAPGADVASQPATRRHPARLALALAAAVVIICGVGAAIVLSHDGTASRSTEIASQGVDRMSGVLTTADGVGVGTVTLDAAARSSEGSDDGSELVVSLDPVAPAGDYRVECDYESGRPYTAGVLSATPGGVDRWSETVSVPTYDLRRVRLVSTTGGPNLEADMTG